MDDLTLIRSFRAEHADGDPRARDAAWRALEARLDAASTTSSATPTRSPRRGVLTFAGAAALAAIVGGLLVLSSGPKAEPAAAEVLRETAAIAAAAGSPPEALPGPGQFLYAKTKTLQLQGWIPGGSSNLGGPINRPGAFTALVPMDTETWTSLDGSGRRREMMGTPQFLSSAEENRWIQAGSPLPRWFDPSDQDTTTGFLGHLADRGLLLEARRGVLDIENPKLEGFEKFAFPDVGALPTEPEKLRLAVQNNRVPGHWDDWNEPSAKPLDTEKTILGLWTILGESNTSPALRAAAFNALAEMPGIELESDVADLAGRSGDAIRYVYQESGVSNEYIFDPETSAILGHRTVLVDPEQIFPNDGLPAGLTMRDVALLQSKVVDSRREPADEGENGGGRWQRSTRPIAGRRRSDELDHHHRRGSPPPSRHRLEE